MMTMIQNTGERDEWDYFLVLPFFANSSNNSALSEAISSNISPTDFLSSI